MFRHRTKNKDDKALDGDTPELQRALVLQYISNHSTQEIAVPVSCGLIGCFLLQWEGPWEVGLWISVSLIFSMATAYLYNRFERKTLPDGTNVKRWMLYMAVPRLLFILAWSSMAFWAWNPAQPETFLIIVLTLMTTVAMNASQSGAVMSFYFLEVLPKTSAIVIVAAMTGGQLHFTVAGLSILATAFFTKIAFSINHSTRTILRQRDELAKAKEEVEQASRAKSAFLATMSHEVRTPLNGILGIISLLKDTHLSRQQDDYIETVRYSGETLLTMLNDILDFSKMEAGKLDLDEVSFDTSKLVQSVVHLMSSRAAEKKLFIQYEIDRDVPPYIVSDPTRLRQILLNLLGNAIKFTAKGHVTILVKNTGAVKEAIVGEKTSIRFEVQDTGIGIPEESKELLFCDFTQVDSTISRRYGGTGLGLSICKQIVELMNGQIGVDSVEQKGSIFWFDIPAEIAGFDSTLQTVEDSDTVPRLSPLKILLAEDNLANQKVALGLLGKYGHQVDLVENGLEAVAAVQRADYDLVLMDMQMPVKDGLEATQDILALGGRYASLPIIALTANALRGDDERCLAAGMVDHISKPIRPNNLYRTLAAHFPGKVIQSGDAGRTPIVFESNVAGPIIDLCNIRELVSSLGVNFVNDFLDESLQELKTLKDKIAASLENEDQEIMLYSAHDLKSLSALFGLKDISSLAEGIERCCLQDRFQESAPMFTKIETRFNTDIAAVRAAYSSSVAGGKSLS